RYPGLEGSSRQPDSFLDRQLLRSQTTWSCNELVQVDDGGGLVSRANALAPGSENLVVQGLSAVSLRHLIDADCDAQEQHLVLARRDGDSIHEIGREPLLGDRCHDLSAGGDLKLVVQDVALRLDLGVALAFNGAALAPAVANW